MTNDDDSFALCRQITQQAKSSFPLAFRLLPADQRRGMEAVYAWLRVSDDLADDDTLQNKSEILKNWRDATFTTLDDQPVQFADPRGGILPAFAVTVRQFEIAPQLLTDVLDGVEGDLTPRVFATFDELEPYCYRVASAVGLMCVAVWGVNAAVAKPPAIAAGIAFQLTNILRDLGEDRRNGRVYLPQDELARFACPAESWSDTPAFRDLMQFQIRRAKHYYQQGRALVPHLPPAAQGMFLTMTGIYQALLGKIEQQPAAVLTQRLRVSTWRKAWLFVRNGVRTVGGKR